MQTTKIVIDRREFHVLQGQSLDALKDDITETAKRGGGMVTFVVGGNRLVTVLITPGLGVFFEDDPVPEEYEVDPAAADGQFVYLDDL